MRISLAALAGLMAWCVAGTAPAQEKGSPTVVAGYLGCFQDQGDPDGTAGRDLSGSISVDVAMTNAMCRTQCGQRGFKYAGTQAGRYCFCGNEYGNSGPSNQCTARCPGNAHDRCGGIWANSVYLAIQPGPPIDKRQFADYKGRFLTLPPTPPATPPPSNGGQCVIDASGTGYSVHEVQRWEVTGPGTISGSVELLPLRWSTTGGGSKSGQTSSSTWTIAATQTTQLKIQRLADGSSLVQRNLQQIRVANGLTVTTTAAGSASTTAYGDAAEYLYPPMTAPPAATRIDDMKPYPIGGSDAYQRPANVPGQVVCEWHIAF